MLSTKTGVVMNEAGEQISEVKIEVKTGELRQSSLGGQNRRVESSCKVRDAGECDWTIVNADDYTTDEFNAGEATLARAKAWFESNLKDSGQRVEWS